MKTFDRRGFTLVEIAVVLLILSVLLAVALPAGSHLAAVYRLRMLDRRAEALYLSAQNRAVNARTYKNSKNISDLMKKGGDLRFMGHDELSGSEIFAESDIQLLEGGSAVYFFDPTGKGLAGVFCSENADVQSLKSRCSELTDYSFSARLKEKIGFYGGNASAISPRKQPETAITVSNGDDLTVAFSVSGLDAKRREDVSAELVLKGEGVEFTMPVEGFSFWDGNAAGTVLLDKVTGRGTSFFIENFAGMLGTPDALSAELVIKYTNSDNIADRVIAECEPFSPLFEEQSGSAVEISCARHFNNLRYAVEPLNVTETDDISFGDFPCAFSPLPPFSGSFDGRDCIISEIAVAGEGIFSKINGSVENIHVVGAAVNAGESPECGILCAELSGSLKNCSVSESKISSGGSGSSIGGLAGYLSGIAEGCSADCDILCDGENLLAGGIAGRLDGTLSRCRSSGSTSIKSPSPGSRVAGIAAGGGGKISGALSEAWPEYIGGADSYGVCPDEILSENSLCVLENSWLDVSSAAAISENDLAKTSIDGFRKAEKAYFSDVFSDGGGLPECVTFGGRFTRFGSVKTPSTRGLLGAVKVVHNGGEFRTERLASFDGFGNDSENFPEIEWTGAFEGEARYYVFTSGYISPARGDPGGWDFCLSRAAQRSART